MGGVGILNTLLSCFCHSYLQRRKQAEERRQAIPEVNLKKVDPEEKEMRKGKNKPIKVEAEDGEKRQVDQESLKEEGKPEDESKSKDLF